MHPLVGKNLSCISLAHDTLYNEFSDPGSNDRWEPEVLGRAGGLGTGALSVGTVVGFTITLRAEPTVWDAHRHSDLPWGVSVHLLESSSWVCPRPGL